jgi:hypothetical protein
LNGRAGDKQVDRSSGADARVPLRQSDACDLSRGAGRGPDDPLGWPCGRESRECADDGYCSGCRYASCGRSIGLGGKVQLVKVALKQAHAGRKEGRQGYAAPPAVSSAAGQKDRSPRLWITRGPWV